MKTWLKNNQKFIYTFLLTLGAIFGIDFVNAPQPEAEEVEYARSIEPLDWKYEVWSYWEMSNPVLTDTDRILQVDVVESGTAIPEESLPKFLKGRFEHYELIDVEKVVILQTGSKKKEEAPVEKKPAEDQ